MKKKYFLCLVLASFISAITFGQVDSADLRKSEKQVMKAEQRRVKQEKKVKRANAKMEKQQKRLNRQNRKLNKANRRTSREMKDVEKQQRQLEQNKIDTMKRDTIPNTSLRTLIPKSTRVSAKTPVNIKNYWPYNKRNEC